MCLRLYLLYNYSVLQFDTFHPEVRSLMTRIVVLYYISVSRHRNLRTVRWPWQQISFILSMTCHVFCNFRPCLLFVDSLTSQQRYFYSRSICFMGWYSWGDYLASKRKLSALESLKLLQEKYVAVSLAFLERPYPNLNLCLKSFIIHSIIFNPYHIMSNFPILQWERHQLTTSNIVEM